jgi:hypothetical protein
MSTTTQTKIKARIAGIFYLIIILSGLFSELFVRSGLIIPGNANETAGQITANSILFRIGFVSDLIMIMSDVAVALLFYLLLKPVSKGLSLMAAFFRLGQASVLGINLLNYFMPVILLDSDIKFNSFTVGQTSDLVMLFLEAHSYGYLISGIFFGISCLILGYLIYQAGYFPKWLGALVLAAGLSYLIDCMVNFLIPAYALKSEMLVMTVAVIAELTLCLYLLIKGINSEKVM